MQHDDLHAGGNCTAGQMIPIIDQWISEERYDLVFLATEDQDVYEEMHRNYEKKLRAISQERFSVGEFKDVIIITNEEISCTGCKPEKVIRR